MDPILSGYFYQGSFYPVDSSVLLGYWYNNTFYGSQWIELGYDFTQTAGAIPYSYSQNGYRPLPPGSVPGYSYLQYFYKTKKEAEAYQLQLYNYYQTQVYNPYSTPINYPAPSPAYSWNTDPSQLPTNLPSASINPVVQPPANPVVPTQANPAASVSINPAATVSAYSSSFPTASEASSLGQRPLRKTIMCYLCNEKQTDFKEILGKSCCLKCLKRKYEADETYFGTAANPLPWSTENVYDVYTTLQGLDPSIPMKYPLNSFICIGRNQEAKPGYPSKGHIAGINTWCKEDGCPDHKLCIACAAGMDACPSPNCGKFIKYEEPRQDEYHPECDKIGHCAHFDRPCDICHKKATRRKVEPGAQKQEEKKEEEAKAEK